MSEVDTTARRALTGVRAPDEAGAHDRTWATVRSAYRDRPAPTPVRSRRRVALVPVAAVLIGAIAFSPAGATVKRIINRALSHAPHLARAGAVAAGPGQAAGLQRTGDVGGVGHGSGEAPRAVDGGELVTARQVPRRDLAGHPGRD